MTSEKIQQGPIVRKSSGHLPEAANETMEVVHCRAHDSVSATGNSRSEIHAAVRVLNPPSSRYHIQELSSL